MTWADRSGGRLGSGDLKIRPDELGALVSLFVLAARRARPVLLNLAGGFDENKVSIQVHKELQALQDRWDVRFMDFQLEGIINPPGGAPGKIVGRIDFKVKFEPHFSHGNAYFGVEGKRVALRDRHLMRYYMNGGVRKFEDGTYSDGHPEAILLGYLIKAPGAGVGADIDRRLTKRHGAPAALKSWGPRYRDAEVLEGTVPRLASTPIRLLHAVVRMHP